MSGTIAVAFCGMAVGLAPVPADPAPDPLGWGYLGVVSDSGSLRLADVQPGSAAAKAGLLPGDEFVIVGEIRPHTFEDVVEYIGNMRPGSVLKVEVRRGSETRQVRVRLGTRPSDLDPPRVRPPIEIPAR